MEKKGKLNGMGFGGVRDCAGCIWVFLVYVNLRC